jgi:hypothetical protein
MERLHRALQVDIIGKMVSYSFINLYLVFNGTNEYRSLR